MTFAPAPKATQRGTVAAKARAFATVSATVVAWGVLAFAQHALAQQPLAKPAAPASIGEEPTPSVEAIPSAPVESEDYLPRRPLPPLGLEDAADLLERAGAVLTDGPTTLTRPRQELVVFCLDQVAMYMERLTSASLGRTPYQWIPIGRKRVAAGRGETKVYRPATPVASVMAVRFQALHSAVYLMHMVVDDAAGDSRAYELERWISAELPRHEVVYLERPATVSAVTLARRHQSDRTPRVIVELGVPAQPEYAREIAYLSRAALTQLQRAGLPASLALTEEALRLCKEFAAGRR